MTREAIQIGISGTEFRGEPLDALLDAADRVAAAHVELWCPENVTPDAVADGSVATRLSAWSGGVGAVSCGVEVAETSDTEASITRLVTAVELAAQLETTRVNTYFGAPGYRDDRRSGDAFLRHIEPALKRAEQLGVTIVLENEFNAFGRDDVAGDLTRRPEALCDLLCRSGSAHLKLNFDAANFYCAGVEPFPYAYSVLADHVGYLHVKDVRTVDPARADRVDDRWSRYHDYGVVYSTTELGTGAVNWTGLLERLVRDGYSGPITVEPHARPEHRSSSIAQAVDWLRRVLGSLAAEKGMTHVQ